MKRSVHHQVATFRWPDCPHLPGFRKVIVNILINIISSSRYWWCTTGLRNTLNSSTGSSKKSLAKFSDTCSIRANGLCIGSPRLVGRRKAGNSNIQGFFAPLCTTLCLSAPFRSGLSGRLESAMHCLVWTFCNLSQTYLYNGQWASVEENQNSWAFCPCTVCCLTFCETSFEFSELAPHLNHLFHISLIDGSSKG